jgi:hypothetical protein
MQPSTVVLVASSSPASAPAVATQPALPEASAPALQNLASLSLSHEISAAISAVPLSTTTLASITNSALEAKSSSEDSATTSSAATDVPQYLSDEVASFWQMASTQGAEQFNGLVLVYPLYYKCAVSLAALRDHERQGFLSMLRCGQHLVAELIPFKANQFGHESGLEADTLNKFKRSLESEKIQLELLLNTVKSARIWREKWDDLEDRKHEVEQLILDIKVLCKNYLITLVT